MDASINNVVSFPTRRPHVKTVIKVAQHTGTRPFLCYASDSNRYWCKIFHGPHGREGTLNEIVASAIGEEIHAPVRPWTILDIPESLVATQVGEGTQRYRLPDAPVFASLALHTANVTDQLSDINRDGNYDRVPLLHRPVVPLQRRRSTGSL